MINSVTGMFFGAEIEEEQVEMEDEVVLQDILYIKPTIC